MVAAHRPPAGAADDYYDEMQERWPAERPSRRRPYQRQQQRKIVVRSERLNEPDAVRMSRALRAAEREVARLQAEADARAQGSTEAAE